MGFVHAFWPLGADETRHILACQWPQLGVINPDGDFTDAEAIAAIIRNTGGNFRLLHRLCTEIQRILQINQLQTVTKEGPGNDSHIDSPQNIMTSRALSSICSSYGTCPRTYSR